MEKIVYVIDENNSFEIGQTYNSGTIVATRFDNFVKDGGFPYTTNLMSAYEDMKRSKAKHPRIVCAKTLRSNTGMRGVKHYTVCMTVIGEATLYTEGNFNFIKAYNYCTDMDEVILLDCDDTTIKELVIPDGVTHIGQYAFANYTNLTSIKFSNSVTSIDKCAFSECDSLKTVTMPNNDKLCICPYAFAECESLTEVKFLTDSVIICENAFEGCCNITDVYFNGTQKQWAKLNRSQRNNYLLTAKNHFIDD